jgi:hypothetical protein
MSIHAPMSSSESSSRNGPASLAAPNREEIAQLAYQLWVARGCPDGSADQDWLEAERQLTDKTAFSSGWHLMRSQQK